MRTRFWSTGTFLVVVPLTALSGAAAAEEPAPRDAKALRALSSDPAPRPGDAPAGATSTAASSDPNDPHEDPKKTYYFVGARYRHTVLPKWMLSPFVSGGPTVVSIPGFGVEGTMRKDAFDLVGSIYYADYSMPTFPFKGKDEADTAYELVTSKLKLINFAVDILWGSQFSDKFSFQYGMTTGIAVVLGDLKRVQAAPPGPDGKTPDGNGSPGDPYTYVPCPTPPPASKYCDTTNDHYGDYSEPSWFNGGKKPNFYPILGPMVAFRYKPVKQFMARVDLGFNTFSGFFFGVGLNYGL